MTDVAVNRKAVEKKVILTIGYYAEEAMLEGALVKVGTTDGNILIADENEIAIGINEREITAAALLAVENGTAGKNTIFCPVSVIGISTCLASGAITAGTFVTTDADGEVKAAATDGTDFIFGICLATTTDDGDQTSILIDRSPVDTD